MKLLRMLLVVGIVAVAVGTSQAAFTTGGDDTKVLPNDTNVTLNLPKFDTLLGTRTLTNVWVQVKLSLSGANVQLDNDAVQAQQGTGLVINTPHSLGSSVSLLKTDTTTINVGDLIISASQVFDLDPTTGDVVGAFNATGLGDFADWIPGTLTSGNSGDISSAVWGGYQGVGHFTITVNTTYLTSATFVGSDGYFQGNTPNGELYGKVVYTYVPEPATLSMLVLGGLALIRRRK